MCLYSYRTCNLILRYVYAHLTEIISVSDEEFPERQELRAAVRESTQKHFGTMAHSIPML